MSYGELQVNVDAAALLIRCNAHAVQTLLSLAAAATHYCRFFCHRQSRPQVLDSPIASWLLPQVHFCIPLDKQMCLR